MSRLPWPLTVLYLMGVVAVIILLVVANRETK